MAMTTLSESFKVELPTEMVKAMQERMAQTQVSVSEAVLVTVLGQEDMSSDTKKKRLNKEFDRLAEGSKKFKCDLTAQLHPRILRAGSDFALGRG